MISEAYTMMNRDKIAWLVPPAAVMKYGCAACTAGPIGVFWLTSLVGLFYGLTGGTLGGVQGSSLVVIGISLLLWVIAAVWARVVMCGVKDDMTDHPESALKRRVIPRLDELDPTEQVRGTH